MTSTELIQVAEIKQSLIEANDPNPLYGIWKRIYGDEPYNSNGRFFSDSEPFRWDMGSAYVSRRECVATFSWAIPGPEIIEAIVSTGNAIVEIGAGTGYWAKLLRDAGVDILTYDANPPTPESDANGWHRNQSTWTEVLPGGAEKAGEHADRTLLLVWPPYEGCYKPENGEEPDCMATAALRAYSSGGGRTLIYVGEDDGRTGSWLFHEELARDWELVGEIEIPQWDGIHDVAMFYARNASLELEA